MSRPIVELWDLAKAFGPVVALDGIDLAVIEGELLSLLGPSGCGKTTTLNLIAGFVQPTRGRIVIDGVDVTGVPPHRRDLGVVFQQYALFPHMNVFDNVAFGLRARGAAREDIEARVGEALATVHLEGYAKTWPSQLSGGMQQRVALARAIVIRPRVLLLDEPLAALDKKLREEMRAELREIQRTVGITTVFVTHDQQEALGLSDRVAVMGQGRIEQIGTPRSIYERPAARFVAEFVGASNAISGEVRTVSAQEVEVECEGLGRLRVSRLDESRDLRPGGLVELLIRPERISMGVADAHAPNTLRARVRRVTYLGGQTEAWVEAGAGRRIVVTVDERRSPVTLAEGAEVSITLPPDAFLVF